VLIGKKKYLTTTFVCLYFYFVLRRQFSEFKKLKQIYMFFNKKVFQKLRQKMSFNSKVSKTSASNVGKNSVESSKSALHPEMISAALLSESTTTIMSSTISTSLLASRRAMKSTNVGPSFNAGGFLTLRHPGTHSIKLSNL